MLLFFLSYLAIYGGAHAWLLTRTLRAFHLPFPWPVLFALLAIFMIMAPILVRILERADLHGPASWVAYLGYGWMGFFFLFLSATIACDLLRGVLLLAGWLGKVDPVPTQATLLCVSMICALLASLYGLYEARHIRVEQVTLKTPKLPKGAGRVRVVQISDVHLGIMVGKEGLKRILDRVNELQPDLLLSTGDLVDGQMDGLKGRDEELSVVRPRLGKFAVLGNHEVIAGLAPSAQFTERCGFTLLRGESVAVGPYLTLVGVDDPFVNRGKDAAELRSAGERALLAALPRERFTLLLKHRPAVEPEARGLFDLQLSGHVHKGQIFPFNLVTHLVYPVKMGLSAQDPASLIYVSRGSGTWGPPIRVFAPPEVTVIDIVPAP